MLLGHQHLITHLSSIALEEHQLHYMLNRNVFKTFRQPPLHLTLSLQEAEGVFWQLYCLS